MISKIDETLVIRKVDDQTLIRKFIRGEVTLLANSNLRVETHFDTVQLLTRRGGLIAACKLVGTVRSALVKPGSDYWSMILYALEEAGFLPVKSADNQGFVTYEQHEVPPGYQVHSTEAKFLWKEFRNYQRFPHRAADLLLFSNGLWCPIETLFSSQGMLVVRTKRTPRTPSEEFLFNFSDIVLWLNNLDAGEVTCILAPALPAVATPEATSNPPQPSPPSRETSARKLPQLAESLAKLNSLALQSTVTAPPAVIEQAPIQRTQASSQPISSPAIPVQATNSASARPLRTQSSVLASQPGRSIAQLNPEGFVVKYHQGRLYITTEMGEVVVEGGDLRFSLNRN